MIRLPTRIVEKPWGRDALPPPFQAPQGKRIGEVWFEPPPEMPEILVKYIFTSEKLSVQVHPDDVQAKAMGEDERGKEECWLVIAAEPGAVLGIGFKEAIDAGTMRRAALDGSIEGLMQWFPVERGDFFHIPAGTVHAIGAGVTLVEIQQNSDVTYRLHDYGRPRALHLDKGVAVAHGIPHDPAMRCSLPHHGMKRLLAGPYFTVFGFVAGNAACADVPRFDAPFLVIPVAGCMKSAGSELPVGSCTLADAGTQLDCGPDGAFLAVLPS